MAPPTIVTVLIEGSPVQCLTTGGLSSLLDRSPDCLRRWERSGLIPVAPLVMRGADRRGDRRLYPVPLVKAVLEVADSEGFGRRRPSGAFWRQRERLIETWISVLAPILPGYPGVSPQRDAVRAVNRKSWQAIPTSKPLCPAIPEQTAQSNLEIGEFDSWEQ